MGMSDREHAAHAIVIRRRAFHGGLLRGCGFPVIYFVLNIFFFAVAEPVPALA
jgi:hypothetical protein